MQSSASSSSLSWQRSLLGPGGMSLSTYAQPEPSAQPKLFSDPLLKRGKLVVSRAARLDGRRSSRILGGKYEMEGDRFWRRPFEERVPRSQSSNLTPSDEDFMGRVALAWDVLFPTQSHQSIAQIAKARLRHCLDVDRMQMSPHLRHHLCNNIVNTMAEYVVVNKAAEVQFQVHRSPDTGSVYSIKVPVTRVKSMVQEAGRSIDE